MVIVLYSVTLCCVCGAGDPRGHHVVIVLYSVTLVLCVWGR